MERNEEKPVDPSWLEGTVKELSKLVKEQEKAQVVVALLQFANTSLNYSGTFIHYGPEPLSVEDIKNYFIDTTHCQSVVVFLCGPPQQ